MNSEIFYSLNNIMVLKMLFLFFRYLVFSYELLYWLIYLRLY